MSQPLTDRPASTVAPVLAPSIFLLIVIAAIGPVALNICMPSMPGMQTAFNTDYATVQLTLTVYLVAMAVSQLVLGPLSDRFGRKPVLICGLVCFIAGSLFATFAPTIELLILARLVQGLGGAAGIAIGRAIVRDCFSRERSASMIAYVTMGMVVGPMVAPYIGGRLDEAYGWHATFLAVATVAVPVLLTVVVILRETHVHEGNRAVFAPLVNGASVLLRSPAFWGYALTLGFASAAFFAFLAAAPLIAVDFMGMSPSEYGKYFPLGALGYMAGNFMSGKFSERAGPDRMIGLGNALGIAATLAMVIAASTGTLHPLALFVPMAFTAFSNGLMLPNAIASCVSVRPDLAGAASGISGAIQLGMGALATVITGHVQDGTLLPLAIVMAVSILISVATAHMARIHMQRLHTR